MHLRFEQRNSVLSQILRISGAAAVTLAGPAAAAADKP